jgi:transposase
MANKPRSYPSDVSDEEWAFCAPYLTLMSEHAPQRKHSLRAILQRPALAGARGLFLADDAQ